MKKKRRFLPCALAIAIVSGSVLSTSTAEAVPQWRLRRWLGRPAIDPTIRNTVAFGQPRYTGPRTYGRASYANVGRRGVYRVRY